MLDVSFYAERLQLSVRDSTTVFVLPGDSMACMVDHYRDGIHLTPAGSKVLLEELFKVLRRPDWKPSLHYEDLPRDFPDPHICDYVHPYEEVMLGSLRK